MDPDPAVPMYGLKVGDMVWGKVKSHPWWPGHIFNESFASASVRRTKRPGHVLVAFYGDSSYGWFDPEELVPFAPHFPAHSRQTASRPFLKAIAEATDELSRRAALGLTCCCRRPINFRPTAVPNYLSVDVAGFEYGGIYSSNFIDSARDSFVPGGLVGFIRSVGRSPTTTGEASKTVEWIRNISMIRSLRKARYEEYDDTYAEAFGVSPQRPSKDDVVAMEQTLRGLASWSHVSEEGRFILLLDFIHHRNLDFLFGTYLPRRVSPLSGPLRIAEALSDSKGSSRQSRSGSASSSKKNKYVLKRRDETPAAGLDVVPTARSCHDLYVQVPVVEHPPTSGEANEASTPVHDSSFAKTSEIDNYAFQKRSSSPEKPQPEPMQQDNAPPGFDVDATEPPGCTGGSSPTMPNVQQPRPVGLEGLSAPVKPETTISTTRSTSLFRPDEKPPAIDSKDRAVVLNVPDSASIVKEKIQKTSPYDPSTGDVKKKKNKMVSGSITDLTLADTGDVKMKKKREPESITDLTFDDDTGDLKGKKMKKKREPESITDLTFDDTGDLKGKKKKKKRDFESTNDLARVDTKKVKKRKLDTITDLTVIPEDGGESLRRPRPEFSQAELQIKRPVPEISDFPLRLDFESPDRELSQVLSDLSALALDPFHGSERNAPDIVRHIFLRFRNKVYSKSLVLPSEVEQEVEAAAVQFASKPPAEIAKIRDVEQREPKPSKHVFRSVDPTKSGRIITDDPTKAGRKRGHSDRQEDMSEKRLKKLDRLKGMSNEKKSAITEKAVQMSPAQPKPEPVVKRQVPKLRSPTFLIMKFEPRGSLPTVARLKARFGRFGPLDVDGIRVFWKTYTCKVLFMFKSDAEEACSYAKSNELFGQSKVKYSVREIEQPAAEPQADPPFRSGNGNGSGGMPYPPRNSLPLKSSLKKTVDESGPSTPIAAGNVRKTVRFTLGRESGWGEPPATVGRASPPPPPPEPTFEMPENLPFGSRSLAATDPRPRPQHPLSQAPGATDPRPRPQHPISKAPAATDPRPRPQRPISPAPAVPDSTRLPKPPVPKRQPYQQQLQPQPSLSQPMSRPLPPPPPPRPRAEDSRLPMPTVSERQPYPQQFPQPSLSQPMSRPLPPPPPPLPRAEVSRSPMALVPERQPFQQQLQPALSQAMSVPLPPPPPPPRAGVSLENRGSTPSSEAGPSRLPYNGEKGRGSGSADMIDLTNRMLDLLNRCSSIVANVRAIPGYVPYSPL